MKRSPMPRGKPIKPRHSPRQRAAQREVRQSKKVLWARCKGLCEMCAAPLTEGAWEFSHRAQKGSGGGGDGSPVNGLASCSPFGCNYKISADADFAALARSRGWIIPRFADPAAHPCLLAVLGWCLLLDDGSVNPVTVL